MSSLVLCPYFLQVSLVRVIHHSLVLSLCQRSVMVCSCLPTSIFGARWLFLFFFFNTLVCVCVGRLRLYPFVKFCRSSDLFCHRKTSTFVPVSTQKAYAALMKPEAQAPTTSADWSEATAHSCRHGGGRGGEGTRLEGREELECITLLSHLRNPA